MHANRRLRRSAFTLLEMLLSMAIGFLLLSALYVTVSAQFMNAQAGRDLLEEGTIARAVLARIANDISSNLSAVDPRVLPDPPAAETDPAADTSGASTTTPASDTATPAPIPMPADTSNTVFFNQGVQGSSSQLTLYTSRVPRAIQKGPMTASFDANSIESDLRRISYWMVGNGGVVGPGQGLARQEIARVTSGDIDQLPPDIADAARLIIAPEVTAISFEFFDGVSWQSAWDGTAATGEESLPLGPPAAIAITLTVARPAVPGSTDAPLAPRVYRHVVFLPAGNNFTPQTSP